MGTRATIRISEGERECDEKFFIYRGHDGFPENILPDLHEAVKHCHIKEAGDFVSVFLGLNYDKKQRCQNYVLTSAFHSDESYKYSVDLIKDQWVVNVK